MNPRDGDAFHLEGRRLFAGTDIDLKQAKFSRILPLKFQPIEMYHKRVGDHMARPAIPSATCVRSIDTPKARCRGESGRPYPDIRLSV